MAKKRTKEQKIKAQQRRPEQIAMIESRYQFTASASEGKQSALGVTSTVHKLKATDLFRYDTHLIYKDIIKTLVITVTMVIALIIISRFIH